MDLDLSIVISAGAATAVLLVFVGLALTRGGQAAIKSRLDQFAARPRTLEELELSQPFFERVIRPTMSGIAAFMAQRRPEQTMREIRRRLALSGNPHNLEASDFLGLKSLVALVLGALALLVTFRTMPLPYAVLATLVLALVGYFLPDLWLATLISARKKEITKALPDALDLLTISVEAGLGFDSALSKVAQKWRNALSLEFARALAEMRMGKSRREALRDLSHRTDVTDVNTFVSAIIQADQLGVSIARVLQIQSEQMRVRRRQRAEQQAHQAPIKMTFPLVFLIFPAMLIVILGPAGVNLMRIFSATQ